jgi:hypothetical protein
VARVKPTRPLVNSAHPHARGLVSAWAFLERGGSVVRDLGPARANGTVAGSALRATSALGHAITLNGSTQYVDAGNPTALQITTDITVAVWVKLGSTASNGTLAAKDHSSGGRAWTLDFNTGSGGIYRFYLGGSGTDLVSTTSGNNTTAWHHVVGTFNTSTLALSIYVDGVLRNSVTSVQTTIPTATANVYLGARQFSGSQNFLNGRIAEARIYRRALSAREIASIYADPWALYRPERSSWPLGAILHIPPPVVVTPSVLEIPDIEILTPTVDNGAGTVVTPSVLEIPDIEILTPAFAGSLPVAPFFSDHTPEDLSARVELDASVSVVATPADPTGNPVATVGMYAPVAEVNGVVHPITITSLSGGAKRFSVSPVARAGKLHDIEVTAYEQDGTPHVTSWSYTYRPTYTAVSAPLSLTVRGATSVDMPLGLVARVPQAYDAPVTMIVPATGVLQSYDMPAQYVVLDVGSGILAGFSMGVHYRAVDRLRAAALYAGAVVSEWREDRIAFGAVVEGTRRALVALAATVAGSERQTALFLAAQLHTEHRETVAALGACLAEWGQEGVPLGADAQAVTRRLLYSILELTALEQSLRSDDD